MYRGASTAEVRSPTVLSPTTRPTSDRADDALPKGTVFRWNPYVATPTNSGSAAAGGTDGGSPFGVAPGGGRLYARGNGTAAPVQIITPRSETAAEPSTPLVDDEHAHLDNSALRSPMANSVVAARGPVVTSPDHLTMTFADDTTDPSEVLIRDLLTETRDAAVRERVLALPTDEAHRLYRYLVHFPEVVLHLALKERGRILADAIEAAAQSLNNTDLYRYLVQRLPQLALHQSGCIALTRAYDVVTPSLQALVDDWVSVHFVDLAPHDFGNYVVQRVIAAGNADIMDALCRQLCSRGVVTSLTQSKAGSHVVERFVMKATPHACFPVCKALLADHALIQRLADDRYGNYVLQAALRRVTAIGAPAVAGGADVDEACRAAAAALASECVELVPTLVAQSPNATNIHKALGLPPPPGAERPPAAATKAAADGTTTTKLSASSFRKGRATAKR